MPVIALQGIRGGIGTTSVTAGLAWALQELDEPVLAIDMSPDNLLRLHFNMPFSQARGWARAILDHTPWENSAMRYTANLDFIPFGTISNIELPQLKEQLKQNAFFSRSSIATLATNQHYKWILLDLPSGNNFFAQYGLSLPDHLIVLINPDGNCHIRLHQQELVDNCRILLNKFNPNSLLQRDLKILWQKTIPNMIPLMIHLDESIAEAIATKQPVGEFAPENLSSKEITTLANWCIIHCAKDTS